MSRTYPLGHDHGIPLEEVTTLIGGKAANLGAMMGPDLRLPVPPGFVISTATCREFLASGWPAGLDGEIRERVWEVEAEVGRRFGDPADPLLVSVRSGAPVSMPGMMDTILNLGLNDETENGLARAAGDEGFARSCRDRFETQFREIVGAADVPADPWAQLRAAVEAVFRSWNSDRAIAYRRREGLPDDLGTAVTVQAMVFGNLGEDSATGVVFTRNPATGERRLYGDVLFAAQGEDVVAGSHETQPIAVLDERLPEVATSLREYAERLERHYRDVCDIEFTIERGRLWMLQVRIGKRSPQAALRIAVDMAEDPDFPLSRAEAVERVVGLLADPPTITTGRSSYLVSIASGLGASPGIATGEIATTPETAVRVAEDGRTVILVRSETSPDDVHGMARSAGILTARGGLASHAAVVARGWGIPAVVGARGIKVREGEVAIGERMLRDGDVITIDGSSGEVFEGKVPTNREVVPEARTLLAWSQELGIRIGEPGRVDDAASQPAASASAGSGPTAGSAPSGRANLDDCLRAVSIKGFATTANIAEALRSTPDVVQRLLDQLVVDGLAATVAGAYRLTEAGTSRAGALVAADREAWGVENAIAALDAFLALDERMKTTVTAWQLKPAVGEGEPAVNDHGDPDYDRGVLAGLDDLHRDASAWLEPLEPACRRLIGYRDRLASAVERALAGDERYVASPRVDSYHGIWFELHEELIQLAGRTREEEAAAGRA
jgi:pyruvate,orthophosphate dikinase